MLYVETVIWPAPTGYIQCISKKIDMGSFIILHRVNSSRMLTKACECNLHSLKCIQYFSGGWRWSDIISNKNNGSVMSGRQRTQV